MSGVPPCAVEAWVAHHAELERFLVRRLQDRASAEDILQDVFVKATRPGANFCAVANRRAWLFEVARNALADHWRATRPMAPLPEDLTADDAAPAPVDALVECIERVLGEMAPADAAVLRDCDLNGMTLADYAAARGLSLPAVKSRVQRARRRLRALLVRNCGVRLDEAGRVCCHVPRPPAG